MSERALNFLIGAAPVLRTTSPLDLHIFWTVLYLCTVLLYRVLIIKINFKGFYPYTPISYNNELREAIVAFITENY